MIDAADAAMVRGFLVNKFRGDPALFADGMERIARATGWQALGLVPYFADARLLPAEDALALDGARPAKPAARVRIAVPILPHIANFDDLDPLDAEPAVELMRVKPGSALPGDADLVILPGSKATIADLAALREAGLDIDIAAHRRRGGCVLGLCGGFQMLGRTIADPSGIEGAAGKVEGLGLLEIETVLSDEKRLEAVRGQTARRQPVRGLRDAHGRDPRARLRAAVCAARRRIVGRRDLGRRARARDLYPRIVRRRPAALRLAGAARRRSLRGRL